MAAALIGGAGYHLGAGFALRRMSKVVTRLHVLLDELEAPTARLDTRWTTWDAAASDKLDLEAHAMYQEGLEVWDQTAVRRLLAAIREVPVCESCRKNQATLVVTWADVDSPGGDEFLTCPPCAAITPGGVAKVTSLAEPEGPPRSRP